MTITPQAQASERLTLTPEYSTPYNAIIRDDVVMGVSRYFIERWLPVLGPSAAALVNTLRQLDYRCQDDTIEISGAALAREAAMSRRHLYTCLDHPWIGAFVQPETGPRQRTASGKIIRAPTATACAWTTRWPGGRQHARRAGQRRRYPAGSRPPRAGDGPATCGRRPRPGPRRASASRAPSRAGRPPARLSQPRRHRRRPGGARPGRRGPAPAHHVGARWPRGQNHRPAVLPPPLVAAPGPRPGLGLPVAARLGLRQPRGRRPARYVLDPRAQQPAGGDRPPARMVAAQRRERRRATRWLVAGRLLPPDGHPERPRPGSPAVGRPAVHKSSLDVARARTAPAMPNGPPLAGDRGWDR